MNIFLTGATGFLGSHTAEELIRRGHSLSALRRKTSSMEALKTLPIRWLEGSLSDTVFLEDLSAELDTVIHIAGVVKALSEADFFRANADGTQNLVKAITKKPGHIKRFIHISTVAVHNPSQDGRDFCNPPSQCHPLSQYGRSKLAGEKALEDLKGKVQTITLRPPVLYGPRDREFLPLFQSIRWGLAPLLESGERKLSVCYVQDVARAIGDLVETPFAGDEVFCLDDGEVHTWRDLAVTVSRVMDKRPLTIPIPKPLFKMAAGLSQTWAGLTRRPAIFTLDKIKEMEQPRWVCGFQRLHEKTGWRPSISLEDGMGRTYRFYREAGILS